MATKDKLKLRQAVIVEIGNDWIKIVQVDPSKRGPVISKLHLERFKNIGLGLAVNIATALKKGKFAQIPVIACLPRHAVTLRILELPSDDPDEIKDMVSLQVGKQTPYSRDEIAFDYRIVGQTRPGYTGVMLSIAQRSVLRQRFYILEEAGVKVERMSVSSEGTLNWCSAMMSTGGIIALDVDSTYTDFMVMLDGVPVFTRSIPVGASQLMGDGNKAQSDFVREVKGALEICRSERPGMDVGKVILTGAAEHVSDLQASLSQDLEMDVEIIGSTGVVSSMPNTPFLTDPAYGVVSLTAVLGMAMAPDSLEYNLVPSTVTLRNNLEMQSKRLTSLGVLVMAALISVSVYATFGLYSRKYEQAALDAEIKAKKPAYMRVDSMMEMIKEMNARSDSRFSAINIVNVIYPLIPEDIYLSEMNIAVGTDGVDEKVELAGTAGSRPDVSTLIKNLEGADIFRDVARGGVDKRESDGRYSFRIQASLEKD